MLKWHVSSVSDIYAEVIARKKRIEPCVLVAYTPFDVDVIGVRRLSLSFYDVCPLSGRIIRPLGSEEGSTHSTTFPRSYRFPERSIRFDPVLLSPYTRNTDSSRALADPRRLLQRPMKAPGKKSIDLLGHCSFD